MDIQEVINSLKSWYISSNEVDCTTSNNIVNLYDRNRKSSIRLHLKDNTFKISMWGVTLIRLSDLSPSDVTKLEISLKEFDLLIFKKYSKEFQDILNIGTKSPVDSEDIDNDTNN